MVRLALFVALVIFYAAFLKPKIEVAKKKKRNISRHQSRFIWSGQRGCLRFDTLWTSVPPHVQLLGTRAHLSSTVAPAYAGL